jgi:uncharacterized membrane protein YwaF
VATLFLVVGLRQAPARGAAVRSFLLTAGYAAVVGAADVVTGGNYMFLRNPPPGVHTLFDVMGPWPRYLVVSALLGVVLFALLELPFRLRRTRGGGAASEPAGGLLGEAAQGGVPPGGRGL